MTMRTVTVVARIILVAFALVACGQAESAPQASPQATPPAAVAPAAPQPAAPIVPATPPAAPAAPALAPPAAPSPAPATSPFIGEWRLQSNSAGQSFSVAAPTEKWLFGNDGHFERFARNNPRVEFTVEATGRYAIDSAAGTVTLINPDGSQVVRYYRIDTTATNPQLRWSTTANFGRWEQFVQVNK